MNVHMPLVPGAAQQGSACFDAAESIALQLCREALRYEHGCNWLGWSMEPVGSVFAPVVRSFASDLYSGTTGIALFLARVAALGGDPIIRETALAALAPLAAERAEQLARATPPAIRLGFHTGWTGQAWALDHIGEWLGLEQLRERAVELALAVADIELEPLHVDVISGAAGAIPGLLALADRHAGAVGERMLEQARRLGAHLLALAKPTGTGALCWDTMGLDGQPPLTGHSHGAAGIATALLELWAREGETEAASRWFQAARGALAYERSLYVEAQRNWPDLRLPGPGRPPQSPPPCNVVWCHGAPGIGLSRLRCLELLARDAGCEAQAELELVRAEIESALATTLDALANPGRFGGSWCLCHGTAGNAELPLEAATLLERPRLLEIVHDLANGAIRSHRQVGHPWPCGVPQAGETPGLMLGLAGIGWFFLRLLDPASTPSVLIVRPDLSSPTLAAANTN